MPDPSHTLKTEELSAIIGDNTTHHDHQAGYNGIWQMASVHDERPLFVPGYCGMNFEFIAPMAVDDRLEPKDHPTTLQIESPQHQVTLHQSSTPTHQVESWMTYRTAGPAHLDWTFRYRLHDPGAFSRGIAGFFFASYIHRPENKAIYLLSRDVYDTLMWIQFCTTFQGRNAAVAWENDPYDVDFGPHNHGLFTSRAPIRYTVPFFLGRRDDMAFVLMFEKPQGVVISHGMGGGGFVEDQSDRHPAWDFFLYTQDAASQLQGQWNGRLIYKKYLGRDDILQEYQKFQASLGHNWSIPPYGSDL
jgi:hypothetical protein